MRKHIQIFVFSIFMGSVLLLTWTMNQWVDVGGSRASNLIYGLASKQGEQQTLVWEKPFDQRQWVKSAIENRICPDLLILGSSTIGALSQDMFKERRTLNTFMLGPTIEDFEAFFSILHQSSCIPRVVVIGIDPWFLNKNMNSDRWKSILYDYWRYHHQDGVFEHKIMLLNRFWSRFKENLSFVATRESLKSFIHMRVNTNDSPKLVTASIHDICQPSELQKYLKPGSQDLYLREYDGHYETCPQLVPSEKEIQGIAETYLIRNMHSMSNWHEVNNDTMARLKILIEKFKENGSRVLLVVPPYHPITYALLHKDTMIKLNLEKMMSGLEEIANQSSIGFINLQNPEVTGCSISSFNDSHHGGEKCVRRVAHFILEYFDRSP